MPLAKGLNVADMRIFRDAKASARAMVVSPQLISRATGQPVIGAQIALRKPDGTFDGAVGIALDVHWFRVTLMTPSLCRGKACLKILVRASTVNSASATATPLDTTRCGTSTLMPTFWPSLSLRLSIADDGVGFAMDETGKSVGSRLIRTFGTQLGGVSSVRSVEGQGTVVDLVFPDPALKDSV